MIGYLIVFGLGIWFGMYIQDEIENNRKMKEQANKSVSPPPKVVNHYHHKGW